MYSYRVLVSNTAAAAPLLLIRNRATLPIQLIAGYNFALFDAQMTEIITNWLQSTMMVLYFTTTLHENLRIIESEMMKFRPHNRVHIPNTLAIFAVVLLLISSVTGVGSSQETNASGQQITNSVKVDSAGDGNISTSANKKPRGLKLGLLLFRRG